MPIGLVVMRWDDRAGTEVLTKYPTEIVLTEKTLMQIYSTHEYSGESGMISLMIGSLNIASYFTGPSADYIEKACLSGTVGPDDGQNLFVLDFNTNIMECNNTAETQAYLF